MRVVVIDDDPMQLEMFERFLVMEGMDVLALRNDLGSVTNQVRAFCPDVVLVDLNMPHMPGADLIRLMKREVPSAKYIVFSADEPAKMRRVQIETGANLALSKSIDRRQLANHIRSFEDAR